MNNVLVPLAPGFEEIEAITVVEILCGPDKVAEVNHGVLARL